MSAHPWPDALREFRRLARESPADASYAFQTAVAYLALERISPAAAWLRRALRLGLSDSKALDFTAAALLRLNRLSDCRAAFLRKTQIDPEDADARIQLALTCARLRRFDESALHARAAATLRPGDAKCYALAAESLARAGRRTEAADLWSEALRLDPMDWGAWNNSGNLLVALGRTSEGLRRLRQAAALSPDPSVHSNLLLCLHYSDATPREIAAEHRAWAARHYGRAAPRAKSVADPSPWRRLRVGYISGDFRDHSAAFLFHGLLTSHRRDRVSSVCFPSLNRPDAVTEQLRAAAGEWIPIAGLSDAQAAAAVRAARIDILVDLSGHTAQNRLGVFAKRPAPIQVTYCGYPDTTGMKAIDYRITDRWCDPPGQTEGYHSENLIRLRPGFICYRAPEYAPDVSALPALRRGYVTFGCLAGRHKITDESLRCWAEVLRRTPRSRLLLKCGVSPEAAEELYRRFADWGVARSRITVYATTSRREHLRVYSRFDLALDTFPYAGAIATCEALWMGLPVVTRAGETHVSRVGVSLLTRAGLADWIAQSPEDYIDLAVRLGGDVPALARLRARLRETIRRSTIGDPAPITRSLEGAYRRMWRQFLLELRR